MIFAWNPKVFASAICHILEDGERLVRVSCAKVLRRLKESQSHFNDLIPGRDLAVNLMPVKKYLKRSGGDGSW